MIDFHSNILPQVDDGASDMEESVAMAEMYVKAGFSHVVATPRCLPGKLATPDPQLILDKIDLLNSALEEKKIPLTILQGIELAIDPDLIPYFKEGCKRLAQLIGSENVALLCCENPQRILQNLRPKPIQPYAGSKAGQNRFNWWGLLLKKRF